MKIKEVAKKTGLTEKTIRYYESKGLIKPQRQEQNGRYFREYSTENAAALEAVATLRRARFRVEEIARMQQDPGCIPELVKSYGESVEETWELLGKIRELLLREPVGGAADIYALASFLREPLRGVSLPRQDLRFNFRQFDQLEAEKLNKIKAVPKGRLRFGWMTLYAGQDEKRFLAIQQSLKLADIPFQSQSYTYGNRLIVQGMTNALYPQGNPRVPTITNYSLQAKMLENKQMDSYRVDIRRRDEEKARLALRTVY